MSDLNSSLAATVRKADYDRFLTALFAPEETRKHLIALYAFNYEVAKTAETVSQPLLGQVRLQWWREAIDELYSGKVRQHETVLALAELLRATSVPRHLFDALIDARENDLEPVPFADMAALESYADASSGNVMRIAARVLGAGDALDGVAREAGLAYALTGVLRAFPFHAAQNRVLLPRELLKSAGVDEYVLLSGQAPVNQVVVDGIIVAARQHLQRARAVTVPRRHLPAMLPASLVAPYLRLMSRAGFDPLHDRVELSVPRRQLALLSAMARGRI